MGKSTWDKKGKTTDKDKKKYANPRRATDSTTDKNFWGAYDYKGKWHADINEAKISLVAESVVEDDGKVLMNTKKDLMGLKPLIINVACEDDEKCKYYAVIEGVVKVKFNIGCQEGTSAGLALGFSVSVDDNPVVIDNITFENRKEKLADLKLADSNTIDFKAGLSEGTQVDGTADGKPIVFKPTASIGITDISKVDTTIAATTKRAMQSQFNLLHRFVKVIPVECGHNEIDVQTDVNFIHNLAVAISDHHILAGTVPDTDFMEFNWALLVAPKIKKVVIKKFCEDDEDKLEKMIADYTKKVQKRYKGFKVEKKEDKKESTKEEKKEEEKKKEDKKDSKKKEEKKKK